MEAEGEGEEKQKRKRPRAQCEPVSHEPVPHEPLSGSGPGRIVEPLGTRKHCRTGRTGGREEGERVGRTGRN